MASQGEEASQGRDKWEGAPKGRETVYAHRRSPSLDARGRQPSWTWKAMGQPLLGYCNK